MSTKPRILIATWMVWPSAARLAAELASAGAEVDVVCPDFHPVRAVVGIARLHRYALFGSRLSLGRAIQRSQPQFIIACDDVVVSHLQALRETLAPSLADLIDRSLGPKSSYDIIASRSRLIQVARDAGLDAPGTATVTNLAELAAWIDRYGAPGFLKLDGTFGGDGVHSFAGPADAAAIFLSLDRTASAWDALKQIIKRRLLHKAGAWLRRSRPVINVQKAVEGVPANCSVLAWRGQVRAMTAVEVVQSRRPFGIATRVRPVDSRPIETAAKSLAAALNLSGVFGIDFILDHRTDKAWVLEVNPRPTQISHLPLGAGRDLIAALVAVVAGGPERTRPQMAPHPGGVRLFPHMLNERYPSAADDLPVGQSGLVRAFTPFRQRLAIALRGIALRKVDAEAPGAHDADTPGARVLGEATSRGG